MDAIVVAAPVAPQPDRAAAAAEAKSEARQDVQAKKYGVLRPVGARRLELLLEEPTLSGVWTNRQFDNL